LISSTGCNDKDLQEPSLEDVPQFSVIPPADLLIENYLQYGTHLPGGGVSDSEFANIVGGLVKVNIDAGYFGNNTCAMRLSHTINMSGHTIPYIEGQTSSGGNGFKYIFRVKTMMDYFRQTFGEPTIVSIDELDFKGHQGIIVFETGDLWTDATGHSTIYDGDKVLGGNYAGEPGYYFDNAVNIMMWEAN